MVGDQAARGIPLGGDDLILGRIPIVRAESGGRMAGDFNRLAGALHGDGRRGEDRLLGLLLGSGGDRLLLGRLPLFCVIGPQLAQCCAFGFGD